MAFFLKSVTAVSISAEFAVMDATKVRSFAVIHFTGWRWCLGVGWESVLTHVCTPVYPTVLSGMG